MDATLLFYINAIHSGGAERVILQLAYRFSLIGYNSVLVTSFIDKDEYDVPPGVERISIEQEQVVCSKLTRNVTRIRSLRKICKERKPVAVISFMAEANFRALVATIGLDIRNIVSVRNAPDKEYCGIFGTLVGKFFLPFAEGCVFQTDDARNWFPSRMQKKSAVIFNVIDKRFFLGKYVGGNYIVNLARLTPAKNQKLLIHAFYKIHRMHPDVSLKIYGTGDEEHNLNCIISNLQIEGKVQLMGLTNDVVDALSHSALFVLSSDYEGVPNALVEAMAVGVPCISTDCPCGGPKMVIRNGVDGILVPVGDTDGMAEAMNRMLCDREFALRLGQSGRERVRQFLPEKIFGHWQRYLEDVLSE